MVQHECIKLECSQRVRALKTPQLSYEHFGKRHITLTETCSKHMGTFIFSTAPQQL